jgi:S-adenosylmethionine/arginine decarboxylase-like enzyme
MAKKKDFNETMEEMDKVEESTISENVMDELYEIYKNEIQDEKDSEKVAVSSVNRKREADFEQSKQDRI